MLKKVFSVVLCVVLTCTMLSAFAAEYTSSTKYDEGNITVVTTVEAEGGQTYTYLAYDKNANLADLVDGGIVYVDEKVADGAEVTFEYTTSNENIGSLIRVNGNSLDSIPNLPAETTHTVAIGNGEPVPGKIEGLATVDANAYVLVEIDGLADKKITAVTVDGVAVDYLDAAGGIRVKAGVLQNKEQLPAVVVTVEDFAYVSVRTEGLGINAANDLIAMGQVLGTVDEFGVLFSNNEDFVAPEDEDDTEVLWKAAALGKGSDGRFAVKVEDYTAYIDADAPVYAKVYYRIGENIEEGTTWVVNAPVVAE